MVGLRETLGERSVSQEKKRQRRGWDALSMADLRYAGIYSQILTKITERCAREMCELEPFSQWTRQKWDCLSEMLHKRGVVCLNGRIIAPHPHQCSTLHPRYYTSSFEKEDEFEAQMVAQDLSSESRKDMFKTGSEDDMCTAAVWTNKNICGSSSYHLWRAEHAESKHQRQAVPYFGILHPRVKLYPLFRGTNGE